MVRAHAESRTVLHLVYLFESCLEQSLPGCQEMPNGGVPRLVTLPSRAGSVLGSSAPLRPCLDVDPHSATQRNDSSNHAMSREPRIRLALASCAGMGLCGLGLALTGDETALKAVGIFIMLTAIILMFRLARRG
jgi:hypothetical protein